MTKLARYAIANRTAADRLLSQMRKEKSHLLVRPYCLSGRWHAFAWVITGEQQQMVYTRHIETLIRDGLVKVASVSPDGNLLYEAVE